eukprot:scpid27656/ scgid21896/ 
MQRRSDRKIYLTDLSQTSLLRSLKPKVRQNLGKHAQCTPKCWWLVLARSTATALVLFCRAEHVTSLDQFRTLLSCLSVYRRPHAVILSGAGRWPVAVATRSAAGYDTDSGSD